MSTTTSIWLSAAIAFGLCAGSAPARASDHNGQEHSYGGPVQTWCDINPDCNGWSKGLRRTSYETAAASVAAPATKQRPPRKLRHVASDH
jgi:hypothetical protein